MDKRQYLAEVSRQLMTLFTVVKHGQKMPLPEKHRCEGFMRAGVFCSLANTAELKALMEAIHMQVLGESIADRKKHSEMQWREEEMDYSQYESPTIERGG